MYGVVLWYDSSDRKAVIWCEDHGDLAFYNGLNEAECPPRIDALDPGDLVQFEVRLDRHLRLAKNPRLVSEAEYPELAQSLKRDGGGDTPPKPATARRASAGAEVVALFPGMTGKPAQARPRDNAATPVRATS